MQLSYTYQKLLMIYLLLIANTEKNIDDLYIMLFFCYRQSCTRDKIRIRKCAVSF